MTDSGNRLPIAGAPAGVWIVAAAVILAAGITLHSLFPRYELIPHGGDGTVVVVFDRWTGQFQRAVYGPDGEPQTSVVVRPF
jgi:hypothetical protein